MTEIKQRDELPVMIYLNFDLCYNKNVKIFFLREEIPNSYIIDLERKYLHLQPSPKAVSFPQSTYSSLSNRNSNGRYVSHCWNCMHPIK